MTACFWQGGPIRPMPACEAFPAARSKPETTAGAVPSGTARNDGTAVRGRKSHDAVAPRRRSAPARWSSARSAHHRGRMRAVPFPTRETGDSGDPEGTGRTTPQATTGDDRPGREQAGSRPSPPTCRNGQDTAPDRIRPGHRIGTCRPSARQGKGTGPEARSERATDPQPRNQRGRKEGETDPCTLMTTGESDRQPSRR